MRLSTDDAPKNLAQLQLRVKPTEADSKIALTRHRYPGFKKKKKKKIGDHRKYIYAIGSSCDQLPMMPPPPKKKKIGTASYPGLNPTEADSKIAHTRHRYPGCSEK